MKTPPTSSAVLAPFICGNVVRYDWTRHPGWRGYLRRPLLQPVACGAQLQARPFERRLYCPACQAGSMGTRPTGRMPWTVELAIGRLLFWRRKPS